MGRSGIIRNREAMANVTNSGPIARDGRRERERRVTPAEKQKELVRRAQAGDVSAYDLCLRDPMWFIS